MSASAQERLASSIEARRESQVPYLSQTLHRLNQIHGLAKLFGAVDTAKLIANKITDTESDEEVTLRAIELKHPLKVRRTFSDRWGAVEILQDRVYALPNGLSSSIDGKVIVDVGAYNGTSAAYFASRYPKSPVLAVEPNKANFDLLSRNAQAYNNQILPVFGAMVPEQTPITRHSFAANKGDHMINAFVGFAGGAFSVEPGVPAITPSSFIEKYIGESIGLLKVDIEGAERELFGSPAIDDLLRRTGVLIVESHDQFMPGASLAIAEATARNDLYETALNDHTTMYLKG
jgi:FkbM family methyltransferase